MNAETIAKALGGRRAGACWMVRCPVHDDREPSLSIKDGPAGKVLVCCHAGCDQMRVIAELRLRGLWHEKRRSSILLRPTSSSGHSAETESVLHRRRARGLWQESRSIVGTVAEKYLAKRGLLERSRKMDGTVLRFHPSCPYGGSRYPCLVAVMNDVQTNEPRAILRTALTEAGDKLGRMALGSKSGAAIKLTADPDVTLGLAVGEGLETVISAMQLGFSPAWALGDAGNLQRFPVLSGIECLTIIVDNDESGTGQQAAHECSSRWTSAGREVFRVIPDRRGDDMNDIVARTMA